MKSDRVFELEDLLRQRRQTNEELQAQIRGLREENHALREYNYQSKERFVLELKMLRENVEKVIDNYEPTDDLPF